MSLSARVALAVAMAMAAGAGPVAADDADRALFVTYCASCHGEDGRGGGHVAPVLVTPPPDLTRLAREHGGEFPLTRVMRAIDGRDTIRAHGTGDMPVWGEVFADEPYNDAIGVRMKVRRLAQHIADIQERTR